jgi:hypothetical protein
VPCQGKGPYRAYQVVAGFAFSGLFLWIAFVNLLAGRDDCVEFGNRSNDRTVCVSSPMIGVGVLIGALAALLVSVIQLRLYRYSRKVSGSETGSRSNSP